MPDGTLTVATTAPDALAAALGDWVEARQQGRSPVLVADGNEVDVVNARARATLRAKHQLGDVEVGGFASGDLVRFCAARPRLGVAQHQTARVAAVDVAAQRVELAVGDGPALSLRAAELRGLRYAHAVPPVPMLLAGREDVLVLGGRESSRRHLAGHQVHRYLTVDVPVGDLGPPNADRHVPTADRHASLAELRALADRLRVEAHLPADPSGVEQRHLQRERAAVEWARDADERWRHATNRGDTVARDAWAAQRAAAARQVIAVRAEGADVARLRAERRAAEDRAAPARLTLRALETEVQLREEARVRAAERNLPTDLSARVGPVPTDPLERLAWRSAARVALGSGEVVTRRDDLALSPEIALSR
jgi:hypothetical protein